MAKVKDGARSQLSGKADGLVYVQFNGGVYARKLPTRKKDTWTPGMKLNEQRFKEVNNFCGLFKDSVIPQIWKGVNPRMSGYALFLKTNMAAFAPDGSIADAKKLMLSTGNLAFPEGLEVHRSGAEENKVEVSWPKEMHVGGIHLKDDLMVISSADGRYSEITATGIERNDLGGTFALPANPMHLYLFFASKDRRDYSKSMCFEI
jgi:hypothetical protein